MIILLQTFILPWFIYIFINLPLEINIQLNHFFYTEKVIIPIIVSDQTTIKESYYHGKDYIICKFLYKLERFLLKFLPSEFIVPSQSEVYRRFKIHPLPIVKPEHPPSFFAEAKANYEYRHNKLLKLVSRHKDYPSKDTVCPHCGATHEYLYFNNGKSKTQIYCKVCESTFSTEKLILSRYS